MNAGIAMLRSVMMMFELDYMASFNGPYTDDDDRTLYFGNATIVLLLAFVLLMPILLMNLLVSVYFLSHKNRTSCHCSVDTGNIDNN